LEANLRLGHFYTAHGEAVKAIPLLEKAQHLDAGNSDVRRELAGAWIENGQFDAARSLLTDLAAGSDQADIHGLLARAYEGTGMFSPASAEYEAAARIQPLEEYLFGAGYEWILAGLPEAAAETFQTGLTRHGKSTQLLIGLGTAQFLQGQSAQAVESLLAAAEIDAADPRPYSFLVKAFGVSGTEGDRVRASLKRFLDLAPSDARAPYLYAIALLHLRAEGGVVDKTAVEALLRRAVELDPGLADAHFRLAELCAARGDYKSAVTGYEAAARLSPDESETHYRLAAAYRQAGQTESAAKELDTFKRLRESHRDQNGETRVDIAQFVSVFRKPVKAGTAGAPCSR
jgi:Flp pilus assembly protein TadD